MYEALQKEIATYEKRTPKSAAAHKRALERIPLGVASNYRHYEPYPIFVKDGKAGRIHDVDGNEYVDHNLCFGALMAGHSHPAVVQAVEQKLRQGTTFGMPHEQEWELAEEISKRYPVEMVRFGSSGTEVTMHACRIARAATGRDKILTFEGSYHGLHDTALVSVKPKAEDYGDPDAPSSVPAGGGVPKSALENVVVASFNNLKSVEHRFEQYPGQIAAIILEPILMNVGLCLPQPGFLQGLRDICNKNGALLIFDEVKTGAKLAWGGASEFFGVKPDLICLAKSIGGGLPLGAFGASRAGMDLISQHKVFHGGTYNTNRAAMSAGLATFREVLTRESYEHVDKLSKKLTEGYRAIVKKSGLQAYVASSSAARHLWARLGTSLARPVVHGENAIGERGHRRAVGTRGTRSATPAPRAGPVGPRSAIRRCRFQSERRSVHRRQWWRNGVAVDYFTRAFLLAAGHRRG